MAERENVEVVQRCYAAFGRGDVEGIVAHVTEDVEWEGVYGTSSKVPHSGKRRGKDQVREFFALVGENTVFDAFEPKEFVATGDNVIALGSYRARVKKTGREFAGDWVMHFRFRDGKLSAFREYADSAGIDRAYA
jgi:ketosteroid isomerase-like protein